jgi:hypothetical protein
MRADPGGSATPMFHAVSSILPKGHVTLDPAESGEVRDQARDHVVLRSDPSPTVRCSTSHVGGPTRALTTPDVTEGRFIAA